MTAPAFCSRSQVKSCFKLLFKGQQPPHYHSPLRQADGGVLDPARRKIANHLSPHAHSAVTIKNLQERKELQLKLRVRVDAAVGTFAGNASFIRLISFWQELWKQFLTFFLFNITVLQTISHQTNWWIMMNTEQNFLHLWNSVSIKHWDWKCLEKTKHLGELCLWKQRHCFNSIMFCSNILIISFWISAGEDENGNVWHFVLQQHNLALSLCLQCLMEDLEIESASAWLWFSWS